MSLRDSAGAPAPSLRDGVDSASSRQPSPSVGARVVRPRRSLLEQLADIWASRQLLRRLVRKELQVKYKNSVLGFFWSLLNPALYLGVFWVVFQVVLGSGIPRFAIFLLSGLLAWNVWATGLTGATASITQNAPLVGKVSFPREVLPLSAVGAAVVHFFLQAIVLLLALLAVAVFADHTVSLAHLAAVPLALVVLVVLTAGFGFLVAAANVYLRDTQHLVELALLAWFWMTPIVYPHRLVADRLADQPYAWIQWLNPMTTIVLVFQRGIYNVVETVGGRASIKPIPEAAGDVLGILPRGMDVLWYATHLGAVAALAVLAFLGGLWFFGRLEGNFAEEL